MGVENRADDFEPHVIKLFQTMKPIDWTLFCVIHHPTSKIYVKGVSQLKAEVDAFMQKQADMEEILEERYELYYGNRMI